MPEHQETKRLPYTAAQMFALVADVESYPKFLPWNSAARIRSRRDVAGAEGSEIIEADLVISFKVFREKFGSRVTLLPSEHTILTEYLDGPFKYLRARWGFQDLAEGGCEINFSVDFEFRNALLQGVIGLVFNEAMQRIVRAFERRAHELYGSAG